MGLERCICFAVGTHRVNGGDQGRGGGQARKDSAVTNRVVDQEGRPLGYLQGVEFGGCGADAFKGGWMSGAFEEFFGNEVGGLGADLGGFFPISNFTALAHRGFGDGKPDAVVFDGKIAARFGDAIGGEVFFQIRIVPAGIEHEGGAHDGSAAAIEPIFLFAGGGNAAGVEQSDFPGEFDFGAVAFF